MTSMHHFLGLVSQLNVFLSDRIGRQELLSDPLLRDMHILRQPQGTNFKVTHDEAKGLDALINNMRASGKYTTLTNLT